MVAGDDSDSANALANSSSVETCCAAIRLDRLDRVVRTGELIFDVVLLMYGERCSGSAVAQNFHEYANRR